MKAVCITDIHGYFETALETFKLLENETDLTLLKDGEWSGEHQLIVNGDVFDRGPKNREALEWVLRQENVTYHIGNHEFMAMFPEVAEDFLSEEYLSNASESGLYWKHMNKSMRRELLERVAKGEIRVASKPHEYIYSHAGLEKINVERANSQLKNAGEKLLKGLNSGSEEFKDAQNSIINVINDGNGNEIRSKYPKLFDLNRTDSGSVGSGGAVWRRFNYLETSSKQVVGHTKGSYMKEHSGELNPQRKGKALNINTIRDYVSGDGRVALTIEDSEGLEVFELSP